MGTSDARTGAFLPVALQQQRFSSELLGQRATAGVGFEQLTAALVALRA